MGVQKAARVLNAARGHMSLGPGPWFQIVL